MNNEVEFILKEAAKEAEKLELSVLEKEISLLDSPVFSKKFNRKMDKLLKIRHWYFYNILNTSYKRTVAVVLSIIIMLSIPILTVEAIRVPFVDFFVSIYEKFTTIIFSDSDSEQNYPATLEQYYEPSHLPDEYFFLEKINMIYLVQVIYSNENGNEIIFEQSVLTNTEIIIDTEGADLEEININNQIAWYNRNKEQDVLIWTDGRYKYSIYGNIGKEEIIKMATSIE